ncbi:ZrgA family zinc uptake protein [Microbulbifer halophilus]|uniref:DUF2796 domain-containing protein n=1 Tax=Microbulbifer halophilus TaxID=453963 RepID=A0ABW5EF84_9GAMM|nr:DUF2796 domain-containing protein [Microbulbifer halophilus]MCW8128024.1 DUF2796 domain-containing protein [Microbulbifer halophilus]
MDLRVIFILTLVFAGAAAADGGAHVHGEARLDIAAEADSVYIEFESPAANLVGFEHAPQNSPQRRALRQAARTLAGAEDWLRFAGADCHLQEAGVEAPHGEKEETRHRAHFSFHASYHFQCDNLAQLDSVAVALFASFPGIHEIAVQWLAPGRQGAVSLTAQDNELQLK